MNLRPLTSGGVALAILAAFGFSAKAIFIKLAYAESDIDAVTLMTLRMLFSAPIFLWVGIQASRGASPLQRRDWLAVVGLGIVGYYGASILDFYGLQYISAGLERLILFTYPTLTLMLSAMFFGHRITSREWAAMSLCYLGITIAFAHDVQTAETVTTIWLGAGFVFISSFLYAMYLTGSATVLTRLSVPRFTALALLVSTAATLGHFAATRPLTALIQPPPVYGYAIAMALLSTVVPVFAQAAAIRRIGSGHTALVGTIGPMLTIAMGWTILNEPASFWQVFGAMLVVAGVILVSRHPKPQSHMMLPIPEKSGA